MINSIKREMLKSKYLLQPKAQQRKTEWTLFWCQTKTLGAKPKLVTTVGKLSAKLIQSYTSS